MATLPYYHVDVFTDVPFAGNGLTVFTESEKLSKQAMLKLTQEMRQFESTFLQHIDGQKFKANIFTCNEELNFAGHPILGAAATLHDLFQPGDGYATWEFVLNNKTVQVSTQKEAGIFKATMNQGKAVFNSELDETQTAWILKSLNLDESDLYPNFRPQIISTGLPYVILPLRQNALKAKISIDNLEEIIRSWGAMFVGTLEIPGLSIRTWDNRGLVEDSATGSLAGPSGAFLVKNGLQVYDTEFVLNQGHNLGRPAKLIVKIDSITDDVYVSGNVCKIAANSLTAYDDLVK